jgi:cobalamin biosynthesis Co2+ chelatase CbiK
MCKYSSYLHKVGRSSYSKQGDNSWWSEILDYIRNNGINEVVIVAGLHQEKCLKESEEYIINRKTFLENNGLKVTLRLGSSPDEDILLCYYVKHFKSTGGGYGQLINQIKL